LGLINQTPTINLGLINQTLTQYLDEKKGTGFFFCKKKKPGTFPDDKA
jgi:hypothetical protein